MSFSPVIVFAYNRPWHLEQTLDALEKNENVDKSDVFIFCDGMKNQADLENIKQTRLVAKKNRKFGDKIVIEHDKNLGLAASIISGVTEITNKYGKVIVLEDDIVTGKYFLEYMNKALEIYKNNPNVWHITGWHNPTNNINNTDCFFYPLMDCWGWATWKNRWQYFEKNPQQLLKTFNKKDIKKFNVDGLVPNKWNQVLGNINGRNNTWAIFWYATILNHNGLCLAPSNSLVKNIGCDNTGMHGKTTEHYDIDTDIDHKIEHFPDIISIDSKEYNSLKEDYKQRFRFDRAKQFFKALLPNFLLTKIQKALSDAGKR